MVIALLFRRVVPTALDRRVRMFEDPSRRSREAVRVIEIRDPRLADCAALAEAHVRAWQAAYRGIMPDAYLDGLESEERARQWAATLFDPPSGFQCVVAELDGRVCGFATFGPDPDDAEAGELYALNVDPDCWGRRVGSALLSTAVRALEEMGFGRAVLWVAPRNDRARRFYEAHGWEPDGCEREEEVHGVVVTEIGYRRSLERVG